MAGFLHQLLGSGDDPLQYLISLLDPQDRPKTPPGGSLPAAPSPSQVFYHQPIPAASKPAPEGWAHSAV